MHPCHPYITSTDVMIKKTPLEVVVEVGVELIWTELLCLENYYEYLCVHIMHKDNTLYIAQQLWCQVYKSWIDVDRDVVSGRQNDLYLLRTMYTDYNLVNSSFICIVIHIVLSKYKSFCLPDTTSLSTSIQLLYTWHHNCRAMDDKTNVGEVLFLVSNIISITGSAHLPESLFQLQLTSWKM